MDEPILEQDQKITLSDDQKKMVREAVSDFEANGGHTLDEVKSKVSQWKKEKIKNVS